MRRTLTLNLTAEEIAVLEKMVNPEAARLREIIALQDEVIISLRREVAVARRLESETRLRYMEKYGETE